MDEVTNPDRIARWFAPVSGDLLLNGRFQIEENAAGTFTHCDAPDAYDTTWEFGGGTSWLEVRTEAITRDRTKLTISHVAYPGSHWEQFGPGATGVGWDLSLLSLREHLLSDANTPLELTDWGTSAEAVAFMQASGQAWIEAEIAAGETVNQASRRGERTIAFYTGTDDTD